MRYDAIVIGSGQGGTPLAFWLAGAGLKTALVESRQVGGTCVNWGCTPTKTMVASARAAYIVGRADNYGIDTGLAGGAAPPVDMTVVRDRKRSIVSSWRGASEDAIESTKGLDLVRGEASFSGKNTITVHAADGEQTLSADRIYINTGTRPAVPPIEGLEGVPYLTNESVMELAEVPEHLVIVGGGYVGVEFGQMFRRFGSRVTIIQRSGQLLPHEDEDIAEEVRGILADDGIEILLRSEASRVKRLGDSGDHSAMEITVDSDGAERTITSSHLLMAAGRRPNSDMLNLDAAGVKTDDRGRITVNEHLETGAEGIWALGDVKGGPAFTHISYDDFRIIKRHAGISDGETISYASSSIENRIVPYTVFIDPQLGRVGMTEKEARAAGKAVKIARTPMASVARAAETDETRGVIKAVVDADTDLIIGFAMLGIQGGEIAGAIQLAMVAGLPYTIFRDTAFAHPTLMESLNNVFASFDGE